MEVQNQIDTVLMEVAAVCFAHIVDAPYVNAITQMLQTLHLESDKQSLKRLTMRSLITDALNDEKVMSKVKVILENGNMEIENMFYIGGHFELFFSAISRYSELYHETGFRMVVKGSMCELHTLGHYKTEFLINEKNSNWLERLCNLATDKKCEFFVLTLAGENDGVKAEEVVRAFPQKTPGVDEDCNVKCYFPKPFAFRFGYTFAFDKMQKRGMECYHCRDGAKCLDNLFTQYLSAKRFA